LSEHQYSAYLQWTFEISLFVCARHTEVIAPGR
jgi:hypothetical protein